jgi:cysteinyl-tRNA synthetase
VDGLKRLNFSQPDELPKATEHIEEQIALVQELEAKGFTYVIDDGVYYDTSKFPKYADFARLDLDEQQAGARVEVNVQKRNPTDFALWKFSPTDHQRDMEWDSPWGKGFPGWHLECSAMGRKYLGDTLDIHSGGIDHVPVHHTNEIAQSEAATGKPLANSWMHTNHILIENEKISKSLGNGITLEDIEAKGYSLQAFRLHVLESHYRSQSKFSWDSLEAAQNRLNNWREAMALRWQPNVLSGKEEINAATFEEKLTECLSQDLNTVNALQLIDEIANAALNSSVCAPCLESICGIVNDTLGIELNVDDLTDAQKQIISARETARENKDWAESDRLRDQLAGQGIGLRDTDNGPIWFRL